MNVLTFTTLYPNALQPRHGIFIETRLRQLVARHPVQARVVAPVPWFPSTSPRFGRYATYAGVPRHEQRHELSVEHPRYPVIPKFGMSAAPALLATASLPALRRVIAAGFRPDVLDAHYVYPDGVAAALLARRLSLPLCLTARGSDINTLANFALPRAQIRWAIRQAQASIGVSASLCEAIDAIEPRHQRLRVLRNGVDLTLFTPPADRAALRSSLDLKDTVLLSVGNLIELKGHHLVIEALQQLPRTRLVIIGDGPWRSRLEALSARLGVADRVRFAGVLPQERLCEYYGAADLLVLASSREGWANVLLEAMACGTAVVATPVFGTPEVVAAPDAGALTRERSVDAIATACAEVLANPPAREATRRYAEGFSWDETSDGLFSVFLQLMTAARS